MIGRYCLSAATALTTSALLAAVAGTVPAVAAGAFSAIAGSWTGNGKVHLAGGKTEAIKCNAYYIAKAGGAGLSMAIRCASASNKIDMRANLEASPSGLTGNWEERQFNASGTVAGKSKDDNITLQINGGGFTGSMTVKLNGKTQDVSISAQGVGFTGVNIVLAKN